MVLGLEGGGLCRRGAKAPKLYQLLFIRENRNTVSFDDVFGKLGPTAETCIGLICAVKRRRNAARAARL